MSNRNRTSIHIRHGCIRQPSRAPDQRVDCPCQVRPSQSELWRCSSLLSPCRELYNVDSDGTTPTCPDTVTDSTAPGSSGGRCRAQTHLPRLSVCPGHRPLRQPGRHSPHCAATAEPTTSQVGSAVAACSGRHNVTCRCSRPVVHTHPAHPPARTGSTGCLPPGWRRTGTCR